MHQIIASQQPTLPIGKTNAVKDIQYCRDLALYLYRVSKGRKQAPIPMHHFIDEHMINNQMKGVTSIINCNVDAVRVQLKNILPFPPCPHCIQYCFVFSREWHRAHEALGILQETGHTVQRDGVSLGD